MSKIQFDVKLSEHLIIIAVMSDKRSVIIGDKVSDKEFFAVNGEIVVLNGSFIGIFRFTEINRYL